MAGVVFIAKTLAYCQWYWEVRHNDPWNPIGRHYVVLPPPRHLARAGHAARVDVLGTDWAGPEEIRPRDVMMWLMTSY